LTVINAAVLKEIGLIKHVDEVWLVTALPQQRLKRLLKKGLSKKAANARVRAQAGQKDYLKIADEIIKNDGTLAALKKQVLALL